MPESDIQPSPIADTCGPFLPSLRCSILCLPWLYGHDDLAEMRVGAHMRLRRHGVVEGEGAVDGERQFAGLDGVPQIGAHQADDLAHFLERAGAEGDADIVDALQRMQVVVELTLGAAEAADIDDAAE